MKEAVLTTLTNTLSKRTQSTPTQRAYTFLQDGEFESGCLNYQDLEHKAKAIAAQLQRLGSPGDRVVLLYPPGLEFISAFFGCLYAGMIAVPAYPPRLNQSLARLKLIIIDSGASFLLTNSALYANQEYWRAQTPDLDVKHWLDTENIELENRHHWQVPNINQDTLALLQYTSGSTGNPKGVMISHHNLLVNCRDLDLGWNHNQDSVILSWLPTFHDMGLVYGILTPLFVGCSCYLMAPVAFLLKPMRWLKAITKYQATHSAAPNFAYDLCVRKFKPEQAQGLDLSKWRMALNGAQPIRAEVIEQFCQTFADYGFKRAAFCPGYGLAEATLKVTAVRQPDQPTFYHLKSDAIAQNRVTAARDGEQKTQIQVGCGSTEIDTKIKIINPHSLTHSSPEEIGEIWVGGATVAQGYWKNPQATAETFKAYCRDTGEGPFLRTGDLGFLKDGQLFVTGRLKDIIIIEGRNHYPQDIELTVTNSHSALKPMSGAAFGVVTKGGERLVVVQEVKRTYWRQLAFEEVTASIREAIALEHDLRVYQLALIRPGTLPKTSSGKIQRRKCRSLFLNQELELFNPQAKKASRVTSAAVRKSRPISVG